MNCKRFICLVLSLLLLSTAAFAGNMLIAPAPSEDYTLDAVNDHTPLRVWGAVVELGANSIRLQNSNTEDAYSDVVLHVSEDTLILDAVSGAKKTFSDLKENETLYAYISPVMTLSLPPQTTAELILCNIPADFGVPNYMQVESVTALDKGYDVLTSDALVLHLNGDTKLLANPNGTTTSLAEWKPGDMVLAWYDMVAESYPAQAWPTKVMVFPGDYNGSLSAAPGSLSINGKAIALDSTERPFVQNGRLMLPVRKVAETLGLDVQWNGKTREVSVSAGGTPLYVIQIDSSTALVEGDMVISLTAPAVLKNGVTFLAAEDLLSYHNLKLESK